MITHVSSTCVCYMYVYINYGLTFIHINSTDVGLYAYSKMQSNTFRVPQAPEYQPAWWANLYCVHIYHCIYWGMFI
jgi:hypothetical protein